MPSVWKKKVPRDLVCGSSYDRWLPGGGQSGKRSSCMVCIPTARSPIWARYWWWCAEAKEYKQYWASAQVLDSWQHGIRIKAENGEELHVKRANVCPRSNASGSMTLHDVFPVQCVETAKILGARQKLGASVRQIEYNGAKWDERLWTKREWAEWFHMKWKEAGLRKIRRGVPKVDIKLHDICKDQIVIYGDKVNQRTPEYTYVVSVDGGFVSLLRKDMSIIKLAKAEIPTEVEGTDVAFDSECYVIGEYEAVVATLGLGKDVDIELQVFLPVVEKYKASLYSGFALADG